MRSNETIDGFHTRLLGVTNECFGLGVPFPENRIVQKFLRALPKSYRSKVTAIQEAHDLDTYKLEVLVNNLKAYEAELKAEAVEEKSMALNVIKEEEVKDDAPKGEMSHDEIANLARRFGKFLSKRKNFQTSSSKKFSKGSSSKNPKPYNTKYERFGKTKPSDKRDDKLRWL